MALYDATPGEVGVVLAVYNASGFLASLAVPAYADRRQDYLRPLLGCGVLTVALAALMASTTSLPVAVAGLVLLGGPAGVGVSLLFAELKHVGAPSSDIVHTRAYISFAWVAGPPLAAAIIGGLGNRAVLLAIAAVAVLNVATTAVMLRVRSHPSAAPSPAVDPAAEEGTTPPRTGVALLVVAFIALQASNAAAVSVMSLFVTARLGLDLAWAGVTLGVAAALEIPALLLLGRLTGRIPELPLIVSGCFAGISYYTAMTFVDGPVLLIGLQPLNAWSFAVVAGAGLTLFQRVIARPGLASGMYTNTRRLGAVVSGPVLGLGSVTALGYSGVFVACAALTTAALVVLGAVSRTSLTTGPVDDTAT